VKGRLPERQNRLRCGQSGQAYNRDARSSAAAVATRVEAQPVGSGDKRARGSVACWCSQAGHYGNSVCAAAPDIGFDQELGAAAEATL
jgi:hypothetical protein